MAKIQKFEDDLPILKGLLQHGIAPEYMTSVRFGRVPKREKARIAAAMQCVNAHSTNSNIKAELANPQKVTSFIVESYNRSCIFTTDKINQLMTDARLRPMYTSLPREKQCPLNPDCQVLSDGQSVQYGSFNDVIKGLVEFAKGLPGFRYIPSEEKIEILKCNTFEGLLVQLVALFDHETESVLCMNGRYMRRDAVFSNPNSRCLMDSMFSFAQRFKSLGLLQEELALFTAVVLVSPDRPAIRKSENIETMHQCFKHCLKELINENHPNNDNIHSTLLDFISDLRTLNTLHSERFAKKQNGPDSPEYYDDSKSFFEDKDASMDSSFSFCNDETMISANGPESDSGYSEGLGYGNDVLASDSRNYNYWRRDNSEDMSHTREETNEILTKYPHFKRKVDSPNDSGIESDKLSIASLCSSPARSPEERDEEEKDQLPLLRRALEAPPLMNTDLAMEEAYKPHKKFRALRREEEPHSSHNSLLAQTLSSNFSGSLHSPTSSAPLLASALALPNLTKSLTDHPKISEASLKKSDAIHAALIHNEARRHDINPSLYLPRSPCYSTCQESFFSKEDDSDMNRSSGMSSKSQQRTHLLTKPTPSLYLEPRTSSQTPVGLGAQPQSDFCFGSSKIYETERSTYSPVAALAVDMAAESQPLNLSTKTPPPSSGFLVEA